MFAVLNQKRAGDAIKEQFYNILYFEFMCVLKAQIHKRLIKPSLDARTNS